MKSFSSGVLIFAVFSSIFLREACGAWIDAARTLLQEDAGGSHRERFDATRALLQDAGGPSHRGPQNSRSRSFTRATAIERGKPVDKQDFLAPLRTTPAPDRVDLLRRDADAVDPPTVSAESSPAVDPPAVDPPAVSAESSPAVGPPAVDPPAVSADYPHPASAVGDAHPLETMQLPLPAHDGLHLTGLTPTSEASPLTARNLRAHQLQFFVTSPNPAEVADEGHFLPVQPATYQVLAKDPQLIQSLFTDNQVPVEQFDWLFKADDVGRGLEPYYKRRRELGENWKPTSLHRRDRVDIFVTGWGWVAETAAAESSEEQRTSGGCWSYVQSPHPVARGVLSKFSTEDFHDPQNFFFRKKKVLRIVEVFDWQSWAAEPPHFWLPADETGFHIGREEQQNGVFFFAPASTFRERDTWRRWCLHPLLGYPAVMNSVCAAYKSRRLRWLDEVHLSAQHTT